MFFDPISALAGSRFRLLKLSAITFGYSVYLFLDPLGFLAGA
jgi:hypothetical protein